MNIKRAFLAAVAVLMVPGLAMAQPVTVTFEVGVDYMGVSDANAVPVEASVVCNSGLPLTNSAMVGQADADHVTFTVTEFTPGTCDITFGALPTGYEYDGDQSCLGLIASDVCIAYIVPAPVAFEVTVDWEISEDADPGVGAGAMVEMMCNGPYTYTSTTLPAGPMVTMPVTITGMTPPVNCYANLTNVGSAVDADSCDDSVAVGEGDAACDITASAFYEGIPTLSQYGMAIMALLMLSIGFVGFRRFV